MFKFKERLDTVIWRLKTDVKKDVVEGLINEFCTIHNMELAIDRFEEIQITKGKEYHFITDEGTREFCDYVAEDMVKWYGISKEEAIARINSKWHGSIQLGLILDFHADEEETAEYFYYGKPLPIKNRVIPKVPDIEKKYFEKIEFQQWTGIRFRGTFKADYKLGSKGFRDRIKNFFSGKNLELYSPFFTNLTGRDL